MFNIKLSLIQFVFLLLLVFPAIVHSKTLPVPSPEEVKKVVDYYLAGKGGPILMDAKVCLRVFKSGPEKGNCRQALDRAKMKMNQEAYLWMNFFAPIDTSNNIYIRWKLNGEDNFVSSINFLGSIRYRFPFLFNPRDPGDWVAEIYYESGRNSFKKIGQVSFEVTL